MMITSNGCCRITAFLAAVVAAGLAGCQASPWRLGGMPGSPSCSDSSPCEICAECHLSPCDADEELDAAAARLAAFERPLAPSDHQPGGYLQEAPGFPASGSGGWWAAHAAEWDMLKSKNEELAQQNAARLAELSQVQEDLLEARASLLAATEACDAIRRELAQARDDLARWQKQTEQSLQRFHQAEQEHLAELDAMIALLKTVLEKPSSPQP